MVGVVASDLLTSEYLDRIGHYLHALCLRFEQRTYRERRAVRIEQENVGEFRRLPPDLSADEYRAGR